MALAASRCKFSPHDIHAAVQQTGAQGITISWGGHKYPRAMVMHIHYGCMRELGS
jgi:hypothetical protein